MTSSVSDPSIRRLIGGEPKPFRRVRNGRDRMRPPAYEELAFSLAQDGTRIVFGVPGGGPNLDVIGALEKHDVRFVLGHGETSTCIMASTYGHLAGEVSAAIVTRGPGAASAVNGASQASLDRSPLLLITDAVPQADSHRVAHQRIDQRAILGPVCKRSATLGHDATADGIANLIEIARADPPGAVHLNVDLSVESDGLDKAPLTTFEPITQNVAKMIAAAKHPVVILGRGAIKVAHGLRPLLERFGVPVLATYQAVGVLPSEHSQSAGLFTNGASERGLLERSDLIVTIGLDIVEPLPTIWPYTCPVISVSSVPTIETYIPESVELIGDVVALTDAIVPALTTHDWPPDAGSGFQKEIRRVLTEGIGEWFGPLQLVKVVASHAPDNCIVTVDAGAHFLAIMPFWPVSEPSGLLISNGLATMGFALPAAIGAALARPNIPVVCLVGDGGLGMTLAELETLARLRLPVTVVVFNDSALSLIDIKRSEGQGGRSAIEYQSTNFASVANAMGVNGTVVEDRISLSHVLNEGWGRPRLIDARIDPRDYRHLMTVTRG